VAVTSTSPTPLSLVFEIRLSTGGRQNSREVEAHHETVFAGGNRLFGPVVTVW
jgi:hypothetical protein